MSAGNLLVRRWAPAVGFAGVLCAVGIGVTRTRGGEARAARTAAAPAAVEAADACATDVAGAPEPGPGPASAHERGNLDDPFVAPVDLPAAVQKEPAAQLARGDTLLRVGAIDQAARAYRRVIAIEPDNLRAHQRLRRAAIEAGRTELLPDMSVRLVDLYLAAGDRETAGRRLEELIALEPTHPERERLERALGRIGERADSGGLHLLSRLRSLLGILVLLAIAFALSNNRRKVKHRIVAWGLGLQLIFAITILWTPPGRAVFDVGRAVVDRILRFTHDGAGFLFGGLHRGLTAGATTGPVQVVDGATGDYVNLGLIFAFHILPTIIFFGSLMTVLYHLGAIQRVVRGVAWVMQKTMGTSGAESLCAAGNIFVGQTEAPLVVKPYIAEMTVSELMAVMTGGFATVAGSVLAAYALYGIDAGHLLAASVMSAPAALVIAKIIYPETDTSRTAPGAAHDPDKTTANVIDAAASGAADGMRLALNIAAMLMAFIAIIAMLNYGLGLVGGLVGFPELSLQVIFGVLFAPLAWCMGVDTPDLLAFGNLLGTKIALNEFVAYVDLGALKHQMSERSFTIATYALCGFANFSSIGIQIGGISAIAPERRSDLARIGLKAMIGGALASWLTACVAGILV